MSVDEKETGGETGTDGGDDAPDAAAGPAPPASPETAPETAPEANGGEKALGRMMNEAIEHHRHGRFEQAAEGSTGR